ncbi:g3388 [Coccomyxa elongata]
MLELLPWSLIHFYLAFQPRRTWDVSQNTPVAGPHIEFNCTQPYRPRLLDASLAIGENRLQGQPRQHTCRRGESTSTHYGQHKLARAVQEAQLTMQPDVATRPLGSPAADAARRSSSPRQSQTARQDRGGSHRWGRSE